MAGHLSGVLGGQLRPPRRVHPIAGELKQQQADGYLLAHGGARFVRSLCRTGLIDEVRLLVHPVVLGSGERIFPEPMDLDPITTTTFSSGAVGHICRRTVAASAA